MHKNIKNETGKKYGYWEVLKFCDTHNKNARWYYRCTNCGDIHIVYGSALRNGKSKHCKNCNNKGLD